MIEHRSRVSVVELKAEGETGTRCTLRCGKEYSPVAETELYFKWLEVTGAVTKGAEWADRAGSTQFSDLIDPARGHSQAAQASAAAKIRTTAANRKLVKFHKDICSQWASSHYQAKQALLATQQRWTFSSLQNETLFSKRPFHQYNLCSMYFCKLCVETTWLRICTSIFFSMDLCKLNVDKTGLTILHLY